VKVGLEALASIAALALDPDDVEGKLAERA
jgi:hypothetical protein